MYELYQEENKKWKLLIRHKKYSDAHKDAETLAILNVGKRFKITKPEWHEIIFIAGKKPITKTPYPLRLLRLLKQAALDLDMECAYCGDTMYEADGVCQGCGKNALRDEGLI